MEGTIANVERRSPQSPRQGLLITISKGTRYMTNSIVNANRNSIQVEIDGVNVALPVEAIKSLPLAGEVYLIKCCQFYKIGASAQLKKRLSSIQTAIPFEIEFVDSFLSCDAFGDEKRLHRLCSEFNVKNEWFALPKTFVKNRANWFKPEASPIKQIRQGMIDYTKATDYKFEFPQEYFGFGNLDGVRSCETILRNCLLLNIEIDSQIIAARFGISIGKAHNDRYNGLYRKTAAQLRTDAGINSGTPLDVMSSRDLQMNSLTNTLAIEADDASLLFDFASDIRESYQKRMGKPLVPIWEEKLLRPNQAKAIAFSKEYQTELPLIS